MSMNGGIATREKFAAMQRDRAEDLLFLIGHGVGVNEALRRVGWTPEAAYKWATRSNSTVVQSVVRPAYNAAVNQRKQRRKGNHDRNN